MATQKELANQAKEKAERAIKTARVAMEAAATRAKTDGVKIEKLEKQLAEARRASNDETSTTTMSTKEDDENENDNDDDMSLLIKKLCRRVENANRKIRVTLRGRICCSDERGGCIRCSQRRTRD